MKNSTPLNICSQDLLAGKRKHVFIDWLPVDLLKKRNEEQLNSWHWPLFAPQEPSIS